jgi:hypothetical protein
MRSDYAPHLPPTPAAPPLTPPCSVRCNSQLPFQTVLARDSLSRTSELPMRNRLPGGWGGGGGESLACPSFPISIMYKQEGVRIQVKYLRTSIYCMYAGKLGYSRIYACAFRIHSFLQVWAVIFWAILNNAIVICLR